MEKEIKLPELGENIASGDVVEVLVSAGDTVEEGAALLEIETDKAVTELPSPLSGVITAIHIGAGDTADVGQRLFSIDTKEQDGEEQGVKSKAPREERGEEWGVRREEETGRATPSSAPTLPRLHAPSDEASRGQPPKDTPRVIAPAAPSVRRFAREIGVDINAIVGTGPAGRISVEDVKTYAQQHRTDTDLGKERASEESEEGEISSLRESPIPDSQSPSFPAPESQISNPALRLIERKSMSGIRRATSRHLTNAWTTIPHVTNHDKADITELEKLRKEFAQRAEVAGGKLTITAIILKVVAAALKRFPQFCASVDTDAQEIVYKHYYHIGVAVDTENGLLVPVIRDVERKGIIELAVELGQIAQKARDRKLASEDMQDGVFTITNLGGIGGTHFSPIINAPEVAILGVSRGRIEPVFIDDQFQPRLMLPLSLSYDHRIIDGADAARFLRWLIEAFETPFLIALEA